VEFFDEVVEPGSTYSHIEVSNPYAFKTPLNAVIADSSNEKKFIQMLLESEMLPSYQAWIKSTAVGFYTIDYAWKKGEHPKRGKFSPDFFIRAQDSVIVIEIKGDEELKEPSEENRKKHEYALAHFERVNTYLEGIGETLRYYFHFLTPSSYATFFKYLHSGQIGKFRSELDIALDSLL
jgi:type III restriction enzyme